MDLTVSIAAFNEVKNLEAVVHEVDGVLSELELVSEILIIDDGSADGTGALADALAQTVARVRVVHHGVNRGLGGVYRTIFAESRGALLTMLPADGQFPAETVPRFVERIGEADLVLGYVPGLRRSLLGQALSTAERLVYAALVGRVPRFQGVILLRRSVLDRIELRSRGRGWGILMELILRVQRDGGHIVHAPNTLRARMSGASKVSNVHTIWANLRQVWQLRSHLRG